LCRVKNKNNINNNNNNTQFSGYLLVGGFNSTSAYDKAGTKKNTTQRQYKYMKATH
jgi:hypothetical protein